MTSTFARETGAPASAADLTLPAAAGHAPTARALLAWLAPVAVEPRPTDMVPAGAPRAEPIDLPRGTEKRLLVDDDDSGREAAAAALAHLAANQDPVSLLITAARLPGIQGRQLAEIGRIVASGSADRVRGGGRRVCGVRRG